MTWLIYFHGTSQLVVPYTIQAKTATQAKQLAHSLAQLGNVPLFRLKAVKS